MTSEQLRIAIKRAVDTRTDGALTHATEVIWAEMETIRKHRRREWIGWYVLGFLMGFVASILAWNLLID